MIVEATARKRMSAGVRCSGFFGQDQQRAGHRQIVALDKADKPQDRDDQSVVGAERNAVELAAEHAAGHAARNLRKRCCTHEAPGSKQPGTPHGTQTARPNEPI
jgi:hypothetical protein